MKSQDDDGLDQLSPWHIHNDILDDSLAEDNSHLGDIYQLEPKQKIKSQNSKTFRASKTKDRTKENYKSNINNFWASKTKERTKGKNKTISVIWKASFGIAEVFVTSLAEFRFFFVRHYKRTTTRFCCSLETWKTNYTDTDKVNTQFCKQILFRATHWIRFWASLQKKEEQDTIPGACWALETTAVDIFTKNGRRFSNRLCW